MNIDITLIDTYSTKTLGIADTSFYPDGFSVNNATIEITPPNFSKVSIPFNSRSVNIYNGNNLGLCAVTSNDNLADLPDGIYQVRYSFNPNISNYVDKGFMRTNLIQCKYSNAFLRLDICVCSSDINKQRSTLLRKAKMFIDGSIAAANNCDNISSINLYKKADEILDDILNNECDC